MSNKIGLAGILEIDPDDGTIIFHLDPRYHCGEDIVLKITNLPTPIPDPRETPLQITHKVGQNWETPDPRTRPAFSSFGLMRLQQATRCLAIAQPQQVSFAIQRADGTNPSLPLTVFPGCYADVLYPYRALEIMQQVLAGLWTGGNPESVMDAEIMQWVSENVGDLKQYANDLVRAVRDRKCLDVVLARLNMELISPPDEGDTIAVRRGRTRQLPLELVAESDEPMDDGRPNSPVAAYEQSFADADHFYADEDIIQVRAPRPSLSEETKQKLLLKLRDAGLSDNVNEAMRRLETMLRSRDVEQSILARLTYLLLFKMLDSGLDLDQLLGLGGPGPKLLK